MIGTISPIKRVLLYTILSHVWIVAPFPQSSRHHRTRLGYAFGLGLSRLLYENWLVYLWLDQDHAFSFCLTLESSVF